VPVIENDDKPRAASEMPVPSAEEKEEKVNVDDKPELPEDILTRHDDEQG